MPKVLLGGIVVDGATARNTRLTEPEGDREVWVVMLPLRSRRDPLPSGAPSLLFEDGTASGLLVCDRKKALGYEARLVCIELGT